MNDAAKARSLLTHPLDRDKLLLNGRQLGVEAELQPNGNVVCTCRKCGQDWWILHDETVAVGAVVCPANKCNKPRGLRVVQGFAETFGVKSVL